VAGKTGTAQKVDTSGHYSMVDHVASFVGFAPATSPAIVVLVSLDSPKGIRNQGGDVAAPVFARICEQALQLLAVPPEDPNRLLRLVPYRAQLTLASYPASAPVGDPSDTEPERMLDLRGRPAREAAALAARRGLIVRLEGSGRVVSQSPDPGSEVEAGMTCVLGLSHSDPAPARAVR
jgi:membrane peptidoglycan carboxypeptidase